MGLDSISTVDVVMQIFLLYYIYMCVCVCVRARVCVYMNYDDSGHNQYFNPSSFNKHVYCIHKSCCYV